MLANNVPEAGERELVHGGSGVLHCDDRFCGVHDFVPQNRVDFNRHTIAGDCFLLFSADRAHTDIDDDASFNPKWDNEVKAWAADSNITPEAENHTTLVLACNPQAGREKDQPDNDYDDKGRIPKNILFHEDHI